MPHQQHALSATSIVHRRERLRSSPHNHDVTEWYRAGRVGVASLKEGSMADRSSGVTRVAAEQSRYTPRTPGLGEEPERVMGRSPPRPGGLNRPPGTGHGNRHSQVLRNHVGQNRGFS